MSRESVNYARRIRVRHEHVAGQTGFQDVEEYLSALAKNGEWQRMQREAGHAINCELSEDRACRDRLKLRRLSCLFKLAKQHV